MRGTSLISRRIAEVGNVSTLRTIHVVRILPRKCSVAQGLDDPFLRVYPAPEGGVEPVYYESQHDGTRTWDIRSIYQSTTSVCLPQCGHDFGKVPILKPRNPSSRTSCPMRSLIRLASSSPMSHLYDSPSIRSVYGSMYDSSGRAMVYILLHELLERWSYSCKRLR